MTVETLESTRDTMAAVFQLKRVLEAKLYRMVRRPRAEDAREGL